MLVMCSFYRFYLCWWLWEFFCPRVAELLYCFTLFFLSPLLSHAVKLSLSSILSSSLWSSNLHFAFSEPISLCSTFRTRCYFVILPVRLIYNHPLPNLPLILNISIKSLQVVVPYVNNVYRLWSHVLAMLVHHFKFQKNLFYSQIFTT